MAKTLCPASKNLAVTTLPKLPEAPVINTFICIEQFKQFDVGNASIECESIQALKLKSGISTNTVMIKGTFSIALTYK
jgi:hypothetical protein